MAYVLGVFIQKDSSSFLRRENPGRVSIVKSRTIALSGHKYTDCIVKRRIHI